MATLPVTFRASSLPSDFRGTPQVFMDAIVARLSLETQSALTLFVTGSVAPTSDVGPWLKDGTTWYVWSAIDGAYVPATIEFKSELNPKPFKGISNGLQTATFGAAGIQQVTLGTIFHDFDPSNVLTSTAFQAPDAGYYHIDAKVGFYVSDGVPQDNLITFFLTKNSFQMPTETVFLPINNADLGGRTLSISTNLRLDPGDLISSTVSFSVGSGTFPAQWSVTQFDTWISGFKLCNLATFN